jgi:hypothetical protein
MAGAQGRKVAVVVIHPVPKPQERRKGVTGKRVTQRVTRSDTRRTDQQGRSRKAAVDYYWEQARGAREPLERWNRVRSRRRREVVLQVVSEESKESKESKEEQGEARDGESEDVEDPAGPLGEWVVYENGRVEEEADMSDEECEDVGRMEVDEYKCTVGEKLEWEELHLGWISVDRNRDLLEGK